MPSKKLSYPLGSFPKEGVFLWFVAFSKPFTVSPIFTGTQFAFLFKRRWPDGFVCPACGKRRATALKSRPRLFECLDCGRQTSLTAGTVCPLEAASDDVVSGRAFDDDALQRHVGAEVEPIGVTYKTAWLLTQKLRRSMIDPNRELLEGVVEVDQTAIPFRVGDAFFEPGNAGKILIAGAVEVIERDTNKPKPRRKGAKLDRSMWTKSRAA